MSNVRPVNACCIEALKAYQASIGRRPRAPSAAAIPLRLEIASRVLAGMSAHGVPDGHDFAGAALRAADALIAAERETRERGAA